MIEYRGIHKSFDLPVLRGGAWARSASVTEAGELAGRIEMGGDGALVTRMRAPLIAAMAGRGSYYAVRVEGVGPGGHVLVSITGAKGHVPLLFGPRELQASHVSRVVRAALDEAAL